MKIRPALLTALAIMVPVAFLLFVWLFDPPIRGAFAAPEALGMFRIIGGVGTAAVLAHIYLFSKKALEKGSTIENVHIVGVSQTMTPFTSALVIYLTGGTHTEMYAGCALTAMAQFTWWNFWNRLREDHEAQMRRNEARA